MKTNRWMAAAALGALLLAGCSSVDSRIGKNRAAFEAYPAPVQDKIVKGQVDIGFTPDQVKMALGEPDRVFTRTTADGTTEVWGYREQKPRVSFGVGLGFGSFGGSRSTFGGVGINTGTGYRDDEQLGVVFDRNGRVEKIEERTRRR